MKADIAYTFERIYRDEGDAIFRFCLVRVSNRQQALDITQDTFLRFWQSIQQEKEILNNRAFLFTIAHHLIIDWYRKKKSFSLESLLGAEETEYNLPDNTVKSDEEGGAEGRFVLAKVNELSSSYRDPVYLRYVEGLSPGEIGKILGISANAASVRVNRGLLELRKKTGYDDKEKNKE